MVENIGSWRGVVDGWGRAAASGQRGACIHGRMRQRDAHSHLQARSRECVLTGRTLRRPAAARYRIPRTAEKVLQRGEKIELLVDKTEALSTSARRFQHQSKSLKNVMWWKNVKMVRGGLALRHSSCAQLRALLAPCCASSLRPAARALLHECTLNAIAPPRAVAPHHWRRPHHFHCHRHASVWANICLVQEVVGEDLSQVV